VGWNSLGINNVNNNGCPCSGVWERTKTSNRQSSDCPDDVDDDLYSLQFHIHNSSLMYVRKKIIFRLPDVSWKIAQ
jgi:hypothetical protein